MKALVLSGGFAVRFRPLSHSMPKQLVPLAGKPVLEHVLGDIRALGVTEIGIIVGDWAAQIAAVIGDGSRFGARITYIRQDEPRGLAEGVLLARGFLGDDDFVMYLGDNILQDGVADIAEEFRARRPAAQIVVQKVADPTEYGVAEVDSEGAVQRLVEKPAHPHTDLAIVGVYFFTPAIHDAVAAIRPSARGELEITDAVQWLLDDGQEVRASEYAGFWRDAGQVADAMACNRRLLAELRPSIAGQLDRFSRVSGAVVIGPGARVVRSRIQGPAIIGGGTLVEDAEVGPYTSVGAHCAIRASRLADSIVLDGATITSAALRESLVGRAATVGPSPHPAQHRLIVGDHSRVEVAA